MTEDRKHIDRLFFKDLDQLAERPPAAVWSGIDAALSAHQTLKKRQRNRRARNSLILLLFLLAGTSVMVGWPGKNTGERNPGQIAGPAKTGILAEVLPLAKGADKGTGARKYTGNKPVQKTPIYADPETHTVAQEVFINHYFEDNDNTTIHSPFTYASLVGIEHTGFRAKDAPDNLPQTAPIAGKTSANLDPMIVVAGKKAVHKNRFSLIGFFAPDITTRNLEQDIANTPDEGKDQIMKTEKNGMLDYTFGARAEYRLNKHFSLQSGLSFSRNTIDIAAKTVYARFDKAGFLRYRFNMSSGYSFFKLKKIPAPQFAGDSAQTDASSSTLHYINIPLALKYNFSLSKRIELSVQAGITARFIAWESIATTYDYNGAKERSISKQIEGLKKSYFNGVVGIGAEYAVNKQFSVVLFPSFNFATSSINRDAPVKAYPNTLSLAAGVKFNF